MKQQRHTETHQIGDMHLRAAFVPSSLNEEDMTVEVTFGTETPVRTMGWDGWFNEVLSFNSDHVRMDRLNSGAAPLLDNHNRWNGTKGVLGVVEKAWIDGSEGRALVRFSKREDVQATFQDVKDGILKGISVGYRVYTYEKESAPAGETPTYRAIDWEPMEISIAPVPADFNSAVRSDDEQKHTVTIHSIIMEKPENPIEGGRSVQDPVAPAPAAPAPVDTEAERQAAATAERKRSAEIVAICRKAGVDEETTDKYIADGASVDAVRAAVLERFLANDPNKGAMPNASVTRDETEVRRERMTNALVLRSGEAKGLSTEQVDGAREFRSMSLLDIAKESLGRSGVDVKGMSKMDIAGRAITSSTGDFPVLLEGTNRRILLANYQATADTWRRFCSTGSVSDFHEHKRLRMGSFGRLDKLAENAEYKNKAIPDAEFEKIAAETFGNTINVSRKMIINDDLAAFTRLSAMLGRAAARSIEIDVYALLAANPTMADGVALFHADHGNIGTGSALGVTGLDADATLMSLQKDPSGNDYLDINPSVLVVPRALRGTANILNNSQYDPDANNKLQRPNIVAGLFSDIVATPRLTGTTRYMFADPNVEPVIEVAFLDGVQTPYMESEEQFSVDGMKWKVRLDYGVGAVGFRGVVRNAGA